MFFNEEGSRPCALSKFIHCKQIKNNVIKCIWSPTFTILERLTNVNNFYDNKIPLEERVVTFEGPIHLSKSENVVS